MRYWLSMRRVPELSLVIKAAIDASIEHDTSLTCAFRCLVWHQLS